MARKRKPSDDVYNARRRAQRYVRSLQAQMSKTKSAAGRKSLRKYIGNIEKQIERTYRGSGYDIGKAVKALKAQTAKRTGTSGQARANYIFQQQLALASKGKMQTSIGKGYRGQVKTKIFYASTRGIWEGAPIQERNKRIMAYFGVGSLSDAFELVMNEQENKEAFKLSIAGDMDIADTAENIAFSAGISTDVITSPDYLSYVHFF